MPYKELIGNFESSFTTINQVASYNVQRARIAQRMTGDRQGGCSELKTNTKSSMDRCGIDMCRSAFVSLVCSG